MSTEINFDHLGKLKGFTDSILSEAVSAVCDGAINCDISRDYYTKNELFDRLKKIGHCSTLLERREYSDGQQVIHNGNFCNVPFNCSSCGGRISRKRKAIYTNPIKQAAQYYEYAYFVTLTIRDRRDVEDRINTLVESKKRFRLKGQKRKSKGGRVYFSGGEWAKNKAAISNTEAKYGLDSDESHVHEHLIMFTDERLDYNIYDREKRARLEREYGRGCVPEELLAGCVKEWIFVNGDLHNAIPYSKIAMEWIESTQGEGVNIEIKALSKKKYYDNPEVKGFVCKSFSEWIARQAAEILKYNSKLAEDHLENPVSADQYIELMQRRGSRRLFNTFGAFRKRGSPCYVNLAEKKRGFTVYDPDLDSFVNIKRVPIQREYKIYAHEWQGSGYTVGAASGAALFASSDPADPRRRAILAEQGRIIGRFRRARAWLLGARQKPFLSVGIRNLFYSDLVVQLDRIRAKMRASIRALWRINPVFGDPLSSFAAIPS